MGRVRDTNGLHHESSLSRSPGSQVIPRGERLELLSILPMNTNQNNNTPRTVTKRKPRKSTQEPHAWSANTLQQQESEVRLKRKAKLASPGPCT